jgi:superfamily II DNA or RNA helicase
VDKRVLIGNTIQHYIKHTRGVPFIAFGVTVKHARNIADMFNGAGILTESIDGTMATTQRDRIIKNHTEGRTIGLTSCDLISEGTDIPRVGCSILMRPTLSLSLYLQACGRACRLYPGKQWTYIHDHANLIDIFGPPWARRAWTLEGKSEKKRKESELEPEYKVVRCMKCYAVYPARLLICPECGTPRDIKEKRKIETVDGELQLVNPEVDKIRHEWSKEFERKQLIWNAKTLQELKLLAKMWGYSDDWAYVVMAGRERKRRERENQIKQVRMAL